jgi:hypothetical protein
VNNHTDLLDAIRCLSLEPNDQLHFLENLGCKAAIDELALQFSDNLFMIAKLQEYGDICEQQIVLIRKIESLLLAMSGQHNADLWTTDALRISPLWNEIRLLAREIIEYCRERFG